MEALAYPESDSGQNQQLQLSDSFVSYFDDSIGTLVVSMIQTKTKPSAKSL
jgi:hypothetical protein